MPTILPKKEAFIGQRFSFSKTDSYKINLLYECTNYNGNIQNLIPQTKKPDTLSSITLTSKLPSIILTKLPLTTIKQNKSEIVINCRNNRPDCVNLANQGLSFLLKNFFVLFKLLRLVYSKF